MKNFLIFSVLSFYVGTLFGQGVHQLKPLAKEEPGRVGVSRRVAARIVGGHNAAVGQFPFTTGITIDNSFYCTSSLLSQQWIVTAAHCAVDSSTFGVRLGVTKFNVNEEGSVITKSRKIVVHPQYNADNNSCDIALIMMATKVSYTSKIQPVTLPTSSMQGNFFVGKTVRAVGWGVSDDYPNAVSPILNYVDLKVISEKECDVVYGDGGTDATMICAGGNGKKGPCGGDSGGPLVAVASPSAASPVLVGVTNFGSDAGCWGGEPTGFARVTYHLGWIHATTGIAVQA